MMAQILWLVSIFLGSCYVANKHGQPRDNYNFWWFMIGQIVSAAWLYWGGFWDCFFK